MRWAAETFPFLDLMVVLSIIGLVFSVFAMMAWGL